MKDLIISSSDYNHITYMIDEAEISARYGNEVYFVLCNSHFGRCACNVRGNAFECFRCVRYAKKLLKRCSPQIVVIELDRKQMKEIYALVDKVSFDYYSIDDIKAIEYKGAKVGYGCLSAYLTASRNNNALIDDAFRSYFDKLLKVACCFAEFQLRMIEKIKPDRIQLFNGRSLENRAASDFAIQHHILLRSCEQRRVFPHCFQKRYFYNSLPHSIANNARMINNLWDDESIPYEEKESIGRSFFESKYHHTYSGDKDYTLNQVASKMPDNWDESKKNYVIFNSSEDEFTAIGDEYDKSKVFRTQYEGILYIANLFKDRKDVNIYLRIHPNLSTITYSYHTDLLGLANHFNNFYVIRGDSDISTYALMRAADKIVTFGSTTGVEASYLGKPVITLCRNSFSGIDICYEARSVEEVKGLLLSDELKAKPQLESIKCGYYLMPPNLPGYTFFDYNCSDFSFLGKTLRQYHLARYLGSSKLYTIVGWVFGYPFWETKLPFKEAFKE